MSKLKSLVGQVFGRLTVIERAENHVQPSGQIKAMWKCRCNCKNKTECVVSGSNLNGNHVKSCGCIRKETSPHKTHGKSGSRIYYIWNDMKARCYNPKDKFYYCYGGRGITVCEEWQEFKPFYDWAMAHGYRDNLTIERISPNGNYEPSNCKWATKKEQANNTRRNHYIIYNGEKRSMAEWAKLKKLTYSKLQHRIQRGWNIDTALETP